MRYRGFGDRGTTIEIAAASARTTVPIDQLCLVIRDEITSFNLASAAHVLPKNFKKLANNEDSTGNKGRP